MRRLSAWRELGEDGALPCFQRDRQDAAGMSFGRSFESILNVRGRGSFAGRIKRAGCRFSPNGPRLPGTAAMPAEKVRMRGGAGNGGADHAGVVVHRRSADGKRRTGSSWSAERLGRRFGAGDVQPSGTVVEKRTGRVLASPENKLLSSATLENLVRALARQTDASFVRRRTSVGAAGQQVVPVAIPSDHNQKLRSKRGRTGRSGQFQPPAKSRPT